MKSIEISHIRLPASAVELPRVSGAGLVAISSMSARSAVALDGWSAIMCGVVLAAAGCAVMAWVFLWSPQVIGAPVWVIPAVGLFFAGIGSYITADGVSGLRRKRTAAGRAAASPDQPWLWDHEWREDGVGADARGEIAKAFGFAAFALVFLLPFHWILFVAKGIPWVVGFGLVVFDFVIVAIIGHGIRLVRMRRRYGASWLRFRRFPFRTGDRLEATLDATPGMTDLPSLNATLRCVQERYEIRGQTQRNRNLQVVCYALWSASTRVERSAKNTFDLAFEVPADAPGSALSERPSRYWELVVDSDDVPGVDYHARFLVPVYHRR